MLEFLGFVFAMFIGALGLIAAIIVFIVGIIIKSKNTRIYGICTLTIPAFFWGMIVFFYSVFVPVQNYNTKNKFAGYYSTDQTAIYNIAPALLLKKKNFLRLNKDYTFQLDSTPGIDFFGKGFWEIKGDEGHFSFYSKDSSHYCSVAPFDEGYRKILVFNLYDTNEVIFIKIK